MTTTVVLPLVLSSTFFTIPGIYALLKGHIGLSTYSFLTATISTLFWSNPMEGTIRTLDLFISKLSFIIFAYYGFRGTYTKLYKNIPVSNTSNDPENMSDKNNPLIYDITLGYILSFSLVGCFKTASWLYYIGNPYWVWYHFFFHMQTIYLQTKAIQYA
jgi:hypothetical protein